MDSGPYRIARIPRRDSVFPRARMQQQSRIRKKGEGRLILRGYIETAVVAKALSVWVCILLTDERYANNPWQIIKHY